MLNPTLGPDGRLAPAELKLTTNPNEFGRDRALVAQILDEIHSNYSKRMNYFAARFSRGSVLLQANRYLTKEMIEKSINV